MEYVLANNTRDSVDARGRFMHFLKRRPCNGSNHSTQGDCRAKAKIHINDTGEKSDQVGRLANLFCQCVQHFIYHDLNNRD